MKIFPRFELRTPREDPVCGGDEDFTMTDQSHLPNSLPNHGGTKSTSFTRDRPRQFESFQHHRLFSEKHGRTDDEIGRSRDSSRESG